MGEGDFQDFQAKVTEWANNTFPGSTFRAKMKHLKKEVKELELAPKDGEEMADIALILRPIVDGSSLLEIDLRGHGAIELWDSEADDYPMSVMSAVLCAKDVMRDFQKIQTARWTTKPNYVSPHRGEHCLALVAVDGGKWGIWSA